MPIKRLKRAWFEAIRKKRLTRVVQDLQNYLTNVEVVEGLPSAGRVLVLSPHPDDESIGCGGTLALLAQAGTEVDVAFLTSGAPAGDTSAAHLREQEARDAAKILGLKGLFFLHGQDGDLHLQPWLSDSLRALLQKKPYSIVFCPWPYDGHSDHAATCRLFREAIRPLQGETQIWFYEVWAPLIANRVVKIDSVIERKREAINAHRSQVSIIDYTSKFVSLAGYRSLLCRSGNFAEAFFVCRPKFLDGKVKA